MVQEENVEDELQAQLFDAQGFQSKLFNFCYDGMIWMVCDQRGLCNHFMPNAKLCYPERAHKLQERCEWKSRAVVRTRHVAARG